MVLKQMQKSSQQKGPLTTSLNSKSKNKTSRINLSDTSYIEVLDSRAREDSANPADLAPNIVETKI